MVRAIMHGCNGKMGRAITTLAKEDAEVEIVAGVDAYTEVANEYPVFDSIEKCDVEADVVIDFSNAKAVDGLLDYCVEKQIPVVLCTTGLSRGTASGGRRSIQEGSSSSFCQYVTRNQSFDAAFERGDKSTVSGRL